MLVIGVEVSSIVGVIVPVIGIVVPDMSMVGVSIMLGVSVPITLRSGVALAIALAVAVVSTVAVLSSAPVPTVGVSVVPHAARVIAVMINRTAIPAILLNGCLFGIVLINLLSSFWYCGCGSRNLLPRLRR